MAMFVPPPYRLFDISSKPFDLFMTTIKREESMATDDPAPLPSTSEQSTEKYEKDGTYDCCRTGYVHSGSPSGEEIKMGGRSCCTVYNVLPLKSNICVCLVWTLE